MKTVGLTFEDKAGDKKPAKSKDTEKEEKKG